MQKLPETLAQKLCAWYDAGHRELPWRQDTRPYPVWLSEIMLQQTRVEAVKGYYARFLRELPTIEALSRCPPDRLTKLWEGLGYYSRVRNLQKAAQVIQDTYGGRFPETFEAVRALPGIGDYTAGAICSICFGLPTPAVDGNVLRVLSRVMEDEAPITNQKTKNACREALVPVYQNGPRGTLTQALMERTGLRGAKAVPCARFVWRTFTARRINSPSRRRKGRSARSTGQFSCCNAKMRLPSGSGRERGFSRGSGSFRMSKERFLRSRRWPSRKRPGALPSSFRKASSARMFLRTSSGKCGAIIFYAAKNRRNLSGPAQSEDARTSRSPRRSGCLWRTEKIPAAAG